MGNVQSEQVAVVIPVYKEVLCAAEEISLNQALCILGDYDVYCICPKGLVYGDQQKFVREIRFDDSWFADIRAYSRLMLQKEFYEAFSDYEYVLLYQLDAFVFSNQLMKFCNMGYDYIGAPWIHGIVCYKDAGHVLHYVGNGGFSLRKVSAFLRWLDKTDLAELAEAVNEDVLIAAYGPPFLKISPLEKALEFAFDMDPRKCFLKNKRHLPFGCHAWQRIDMEFWRPYIERYGYNLQAVSSSGLYDRYQQRYRLEDVRNALLDKMCDRKNIELKIQKLTDAGARKLYIWGTGTWGTFAGRIFSEYGIPFEGFIDNYGECRKHFGHLVFNGRVFLEYGCQGRSIFVAVMSADELVFQIEQAGYVHAENYITLEDM